jgi:hypothetical protein
VRVRSQGVQPEQLSARAPTDSPQLYAGALYIHSNLTDRLGNAAPSPRLFLLQVWSVGVFSIGINEYPTFACSFPRPPPLPPQSASYMIFPSAMLFRFDFDAPSHSLSPPVSHHRSRAPPAINAFLCCSMWRPDPFSAQAAKDRVKQN